MINKLQYHQEIKVGEGCSRCGGILTTISKGGKVFLVCLRCTNRSLVSREHVEGMQVDLLRENR